MKYSQDIDYTKCKFISDGTWFDRHTEVKCVSFWFFNKGADASGIFRGIRTAQNELGETKELGTKYEDEEVCSFQEFDIYNKDGEKIYEREEY